ncbi:ABC transporter substrate-binding protein [Kiloniella laminariae]|uniref:ABC transporter substrate-binding protein n=1 Tax=Kiloniella laminariae TaxID=454162 RepID=A0ABT4LRW8_9PROT|nr:ABC transporter substrate-binding protein [Kiloniella laminariae]MCZ4283066.1 ABC transporter substrate-binding protein [Kiloniella laminariae]
MSKLETTRRTFIQGAGILAGLTALPGVTWSATKDVLKIRVEKDIAVLDPAYETGMLEEAVIRSIFVSLIELEDIRSGSNWKLAAAESMDQIDAKTIRFKLREGLNWTGEYGPVTAEDVKYSFERVADPELKSPWAYQFEKLDHVEVIDERTGIIHLKEPFAPLWLMSLPWYGGHIVCKAAVEKAGGKFNVETPATCGPFVVEKWQPKEKLILVANPDWTGPKPDFNKIEFIIVEDNESALLAYEAGAFDFSKISISAVPRIQKNPPADTTLLMAQSSRYVWISLNLDHPKLKDERVRQALQHAFDGDSVLAGAYNNLVERSAGVVQPGTKSSRAENKINKVDYDKARSLLDEAGASDLMVKLSVLNTTTDMAIAQIVQATMTQAGITVEIEPYDEGVYWTLGDQASGDGWKEQEMILMAFNGGLDPAENLTWFRPEQIGVWNWSRYNSPEFESLYQQGLVETDVEKRATIYHKMEMMMEESGGFIFITHEPLVAVHRSNIAPVILADNQLVPAATKLFT